MELKQRLSQDGKPNSIIGRAIAMRGGAPEPEKTDNSPDIAIGAAVRAFLRELDGEQHPGIVTPSQLFSLFHRHLQVERGSFLVYEPSEGAFVPIATVGLDETSRFRFRLDDSMIKNLRIESRVRVLSSDERESLQSVVSSGDYRRSPRIALFPFTHLKSVLAILVVFDSPMLELDRTVLDVLLAALTDRIGRMLFDGREKPLARRARASVFDPGLISDAIARSQQKAEERGSEIICIEVGLSPILQAVVSAHPHLDTNRLTEDILTTVALLTSKEWITVQQPGVRVILIGVQDNATDPELLVHLLSTTLRQLFSAGSAVRLQYSLRNPQDLSGDRPA